MEERYVLILFLVMLIIISISSVYAKEVSNINHEEIERELRNKEKSRVIVELREDSPSLPAKILRFFGLQKEPKEKIKGIIGEDKVHFEFKDAISATIDKKDILKLKENKAIKEIREAEIYYPLLQDSVPLINASIVHQIQLNGNTLTGKGQTICIIDSGVNYTHPDLGGCLENNDPTSTCKVLGGHDFCADKSDCTTQDEDPMDFDGHGTHVSGIASANGLIKGVAPDSKLVVHNVCGRIFVEGLGYYTVCYEDAIKAAINWCVTNASTFNISVISMSLGKPGTSQNCDAQSFLTQEVNSAVVKGISVVAGTGNQNSISQIFDPACISSVIPVTSTDKQDNISPFSNRNSLVQLTAPGGSSGGGYGICSASQSDPERICSTGISGDYVTAGGTSMATPHVSGVIAILNQFLKIKGLSKTPQELESVLNASGKQIFDSGSGLTFSRIDVYNALSTLSPNFLTCGDSIINGNEQCDDGNTLNGDGCSGSCLLECTDNDKDGYNQTLVGCGIADCDDNNLAIYPNAPELCDGIDNQCSGDVGFGTIDEGCGICGNGVLNTGESCDDGNIVSGDGCSNTCALESNGLVGYWPFDDGTAKDLSENRNHGTVNGAIWTSSGKSGGAFSFDGVNDYIEVPDGNSLDLPANFTILAWINPKITSNKGQAIVSKWDSSALDGAKNLIFYQWATALKLHVNKGGSVSVLSNSKIVSGVWNHVAVVYNGTSASFYINGTFDVTKVYNQGAPVANSINLRIGSVEKTTQFFNGTLDEVMIFNKTLSSAEIQDIYLNGLGGGNSVCGDNIVEVGEVCDGNSQICIINGYSGTQLCNAQCNGWNICLTNEFCGDSIINGNEQCDDGNTLNGDGCSGSCLLECTDNDKDGYNQTLVGCGIADCDDNNLAIYPNAPELCDGIDNQCSGDVGFGTIDEGCGICGNGVLNTGESCDDGNILSGDGCSSICALESNGLVGYWSFDDGTANDLSGRGNDGVVQGAKWIANGKIGGAYEFNGSVAIQVNNTKWDINWSKDEFTVAVWIKTVNKETAQALLSTSASSGCCQTTFSIGGGSNSGGKVIFRTTNASSSVHALVSAKDTVLNNEWYHLTFARNKTRKNIYVNGVINISVNLPNHFVDISSRSRIIEIGRRTSNVWNFNGVLDEIRVYNRALTLTEIQEIYNAV